MNMSKINTVRRNLLDQEKVKTEKKKLKTFPVSIGTMVIVHVEINAIMHMKKSPLAIIRTGAGNMSAHCITSTKH